MKILILSIIIVILVCTIAITYTALADGFGIYTPIIGGNATNIITEFDEIYRTALTSPFQTVSDEIGDDNICQFYRKLIGEIGLGESTQVECDSILCPYLQINDM